MEVYKCDFCGKTVESRELAVDLPTSFYEGVADNVNCNLDEGEEPTTDAKLAKQAGRIWLCVGTEGERISEFGYDACSKCLVKLIEAQKLAEERNT